MNNHKLTHCLILVFVLGLLGCTKDNNKNTITECIGTVVEETTMNRLPNVKVSVTNGNRVLVSSITDYNGAFSISVDFEKVTERDSLLLDGSPQLPYQRKYALKGMGKEQYHYGTLMLGVELTLKTFQYSGAMYYVHPDAGTMTWESAYDFCENLTFAGYSDWFLPDKDELNAMYINRYNIGGFVTAGTDFDYWSSEYEGEIGDYDYSWCQSFANGMQYVNDINKYKRVRPIRKDYHY